MSDDITQYDSGATRSPRGHKLAYHGFLSPAVLKLFAEYMHKHRTQSDGSLRAPDNWKKGMPQEDYYESDIRHTMDFWRMMDGFKVIDPDTNEPATLRDLQCARLFNIMGWLLEDLKQDDTEL